jgi:dTMP kinase
MAKENFLRRTTYDARRKTKSFFITFDGPEGCGKSTHSKQVVEYLKSKGKDVVYTREPGGTKIGEAIRGLLLDQRNKGMAVLAEAFLYLAARAQIVDEVILPALKKGKIVICDRFQDATIVYQGYAGGLDIDMLNKLGEMATGGLKPNLTISLDIDTKLGLTRAGYKDRMEKKSIAFHKKVREGYLALAKKEPNRVKVVEVKDTIYKTQETIRKIVDKHVF